jgi:predicted RNase H-like HicB family nuclease
MTLTFYCWRVKWTKAAIIVVLKLNRDLKQKKAYMNRKVSIVIEKDEYGYYAYCPELPGCQSQGETFEEVNANIKEALELYVETLLEEEREQYLSKEIYTTAMEVSFA